jgi:uncharacterized RDD family membrane protein YckC
LENLTENISAEQLNQMPIYATFRERLGAFFIDVLIGLILLPITIYNIPDWKSTLICILAIMLGLSYKPIFEYTYGATLGKMAMKLAVVNYQFESPSLKEICLRNSIHLVIGFLNLIQNIMFFSMSEFVEITTFKEYQTFLAIHQSSFLKYLGFISIIDIATMYSDKQNRTFHDKIGKTLVINRERYDYYSRKFD